MVSRSLRTGFFCALSCFAGCVTPKVASRAEASKTADASEAAPLAAVELVDSLLAPPPPRGAQLTVVFVLDGLRPDMITAEDTPNLHALRTGGVSFSASHSVFPTVTRVNASAIATGRYPAASGIIGNVIYAPEVDPANAISTGEYAKLRALDEVSGRRLLLSSSLGEVLAAHGKRLAVVSSSGNGCALLLNHRAPEGTGMLINGYLEPGKLVAFPKEVNDEVIKRFGHTPERADTSGAPVDWAEQVLRDYVLPELKPDVVVNWLTQPDGAQHKHGVRSPEALSVIRNDDRNIGLVLEKLRTLGLYDKANIFVLSDHGFSGTDQIVNLADELIKAGLKESATSTDVVLAGNALYVREHDRARIRRIAEFLQTQAWVDSLFTHARESEGEGVQPLGFVPGTFSLELVHQDAEERSADLIVTFPWSSRKSRHGSPGVSGRESYGAEATGADVGDSASHGNLSTWDVRNTWLAWGVDFKDGVSSPLPVGNVDLFPSVLALLGIAAPADGRVVTEALEGGPDVEQVPLATRTYFAENAQNGYRAALQVTELGRYRYIDKSFRLPAHK